jgi:hypothetical protein
MGLDPPDGANRIDTPSPAALPFRRPGQHILDRQRNPPRFRLPVIFQSARISSKLLREDLAIEVRWSTSSEFAMADDMMQVVS